MWISGISLLFKLKNKTKNKQKQTTTLKQQLKGEKFCFRILTVILVSDLLMITSLTIILTIAGKSVIIIVSTSNNNDNDKMITWTHSLVISGPNHTLLWPLNATPDRAIGYGWPRVSSETTHTRTIKESAVSPYFNHENVDIEPCFIFYNCNSRNCVCFFSFSFLFF